MSSTEEKPKLTLAEWAAAQFKTVPHPVTLRRWAREKQISPAPELVGRNYLVLPDAQYVGKEKAR